MAEFYEKESSKRGAVGLNFAWVQQAVSESLQSRFIAYHELLCNCMS